MKSFADWTSDLAAANNAPKDASWLDESWAAWVDMCVVEVDDTMTPHAICVGCGKWTEVECAAHEFDPAYHYCNGSPRCCP